MFCGGGSAGGCGDRTQKNMRHAIVPSRQPINAEIIAVFRFRSFAISEFQHQFIVADLSQGTTAVCQAAK